MKILSIKTFVLSNKLKEYKFPLPSYFYDGILLVKIKTDQDIYSFIEISPYATNIKKLKLIYDKKIIPFLKNQNVSYLLNLREEVKKFKFGNFISSVIIASITQIYFDLLSKFKKKTISKILNKNLSIEKRKVKLYASGGMIFEDQDYNILIEEALAAQENGFYGWKFRPKTPNNNPSHNERKKNPPSFDKKLIISFINNLKKRVNSNFKIMIDFGQRITNLEENLDLLIFLSENNIYFIEEPIKYSITKYSKLHNKVNINVSGCESFTSTGDYYKWTNKSLIQFIQPDTNLIAIDKLYKYFNQQKFKNIIMHNWCLPFNMIFNISLHKALILDNLFEYNITFNPLRDMIFQENFKMKNNIPVLDNFNSNVEISNELLKKFDISDMI